MTTFLTFSPVYWYNPQNNTSGIFNYMYYLITQGRRDAFKLLGMMGKLVRRISNYIKLVVQIGIFRGRIHRQHECFKKIIIIKQLRVVCFICTMN